MASITARKNKNGEVISYRIRVARGYDSSGNKLKPYEMTWKPTPKMTAKQIEKELQRQATLFEEQCKMGLSGDGRQKFSDYAEYVINLKEQSGELRHHTVVRYRELLKRVNEGIGHFKICDIRPQHLNKLYEELSKEGLRKNSGKAIINDSKKLKELIKQQGYTNTEIFAKEAAKISATTFRQSVKGVKVTIETAEKIAAALHINTAELFHIEYDNRPLSAKTIREHHILIHLVLHQAECEMLIP